MRSEPGFWGGVTDTESLNTQLQRNRNRLPLGERFGWLIALSASAMQMQPLNAR